MQEQQKTDNIQHGRFGGRIKRNWSVSGRIVLLTVLAAAGIAGLGGTYLVGDMRLAEEDAAVRVYEEMERRVSAIDSGTLQLRRREKDFILRSDPKYAENYREISSRVLADLQAVRAMDVSSRVARELDIIRDKLIEHRAAFDALVTTTTSLGLDENSGLQGALRDAVHGVESKLEEYDLDALTVKMLMMRRHEKDFIMRGDQKYIDRIDSRRAEFGAELAAAVLPESARAEILRLLDQYVRAFKAYTIAYAEEKEIRQQLSTIYAETEPHLETLFSVGREGSDAAWASADDIRQATQKSMVSIGATILAIFLLSAAGLARSIVRPVRDMTSAMARLADGDTEVVIPSAERGDEIGEMARAVQVFKESAIRNRLLEAEKAEADQQAKQRRREIIDQLMEEFDRQVAEGLDSVASSASELEETARLMSTTAEEVSRQSAAVATASDQATVNVQTVATTAEELSASINEIGRQVNQSAKIAANAVSEAELTNKTVLGLAEAAQEIGEVVELINSIAGQTNLLALNATIEAARAGDAGKGFAVVAQEVKNLANQTAKATDDIVRQITTVQEETSDAVTAIEKIGGIIGEINDIATTIASAIEEQGASTQEIARNVQQAARGTQDVNDNIGTVSKAAGEAGTAAGQVLGASRDMARRAEDLRGQVDQFLGGIKAA